MSRWLVCPPLHYTVAYEINPWMKVERGPDKVEAKKQWEALYKTFQKLGAEIESIEQLDDQPDMVFTANAGLISGKKVVLSRFKFDERAGEEEEFKKWFEASGYQVLYPKNDFEGEGDALFSGDLLVGGYGFRTDEPVFEEVKVFLGVKELVLCQLVDPYFYHLDTCFCPLDSGRAIYYPPAFSAESISRLKSKFEMFEIPEADARKFACNAVIFDKNIVIPAGCEGTEKLLQKLGYTPYPVKLDEFIKAGGAAKCLCLKLDNP